MKSRTATPVLVFAALLALSCSAVGAERYLVATTLSHEGMSFASPSFIVSDGEPARLEVADPDGYTLSLTVTAAGNDRLKIAMHLDSAHGSMSPVMLVGIGEPASVSADALEIGLKAAVHDE